MLDVPPPPIPTQLDLPHPLQMVVLVLGIVLLVAQFVLVIYAAFKAWAKLPGPQAALYSILCLFCLFPVPFVGPLILLAIARKHGQKPQGT